eukprot:PLAT4368.5.p1 GENE.PLAT4368.5~~PLAT4368.5.p1  ORF type:complete len:650 (-),score=227.07 PLAT4368.5:65-2014(-)
MAWYRCGEGVALDEATSCRLSGVNYLRHAVYQEASDVRRTAMAAPSGHSKLVVAASLESCHVAEDLLDSGRAGSCAVSWTHSGADLLLSAATESGFTVWRLPSESARDAQLVKQVATADVLSLSWSQHPTLPTALLVQSSESLVLYPLEQLELVEGEPVGMPLAERVDAAAWSTDGTDLLETTAGELRLISWKEGAADWSEHSQTKTLLVDKWALRAEPEPRGAVRCLEAAGAHRRWLVTTDNVMVMPSEPAALRLNSVRACKEKLEEHRYKLGAPSDIAKSLPAETIGADGLALLRGSGAAVKGDPLSLLHRAAASASGSQLSFALPGVHTAGSVASGGYSQPPQLLLLVGSPAVVVTASLPLQLLSADLLAYAGEQELAVVGNHASPSLFVFSVNGSGMQPMQTLSLDDRMRAKGLCAAAGRLWLLSGKKAPSSPFFSAAQSVWPLTLSSYEWKSKADEEEEEGDADSAVLPSSGHVAAPSVEQLRSLLTEVTAPLMRSLSAVHDKLDALAGRVDALELAVSSSSTALAVDSADSGVEEGKGEEGEALFPLRLPSSSTKAAIVDLTSLTGAAEAGVIDLPHAHAGSGGDGDAAGASSSAFSLRLPSAGSSSLSVGGLMEASSRRGPLVLTPDLPGLDYAAALSGKME